MQDHDTLYVPWGSADIFFPTDFELLAALYRSAAAGGAALRRASGLGGQPTSAGGGPGGTEAFHLPAGEFLSNFAPSKRTRVLSGWNPMLNDWPNTRIFLGSRRP